MVFKFILAIDGWEISQEISSRWMSLDLTDDKSTLVQVMAWSRQATSHYLSQCWPRSVSPYGVTRPQWVNTLRHFQMHFFHENIWISLKFVPKGPFNNISALVEIMPWCQTGDKPLSEPTSTIRTPTFREYPRSLPMNKFQTRSPIYELGGDLDPKYVPTKFDHDRRRIAPRESCNRLGRSKWLISSLGTHLTNHVFHEWTQPRSWPEVRS